MFPFTFKKKFTFNTSDSGHIEKEEIINAFKIQFDYPQISGNELSFKNFNVFYKRHGWLDEGTLVFEFSDDSFSVEIELEFFIFSFIFLFASCALIALNLSDLWFGIIGVISFLLFYSLLYFWTVIMFKSCIFITIENILNQKKSS